VGKMSLNRVSQKGEDISALLAASFNHRQHGFDETTDRRLRT
jgi:hypothetical protein